MLGELTSLLENHALVASMLASAIFGMAAERLISRYRRHAWRKKNSWRWKTNQRGRLEVAGGAPADPKTLSTKPKDAADQLRIVMGAAFAAQPLLNRSEARLFKELDQVVISCNPSWQVMAQVSLGEILSCRDAEAYSCINSKRVDLLLVDEHCRPRHAVEYQGGGHHQGTAAARDAVKKEALRRAGIGYHEVLAGKTTPSDLRSMVERLVDKPKPVEGHVAPQDQPRVSVA